MGELRRIDLFEAPTEPDESDPEGYRGLMNRFGPSIGAEKLGGSIYDLPPGQSVCPYHYEFPEEEWAIGLTGVLTVRHPGGEEELRGGEVVCFPPGPEGAHKITNRSDEPARLLMMSTRSSPTVAVYPDSDKIGIFDTGDGNADLIFRQAGSAEYYEGES